MLHQLLCLLGLHKPKSLQTLLPNRHAPVITGYILHVECACCGLVLHHEHSTWNGYDFETVIEPLIAT